MTDLSDRKTEKKEMSNQFVAALLAGEDVDQKQGTKHATVVSSEGNSTTDATKDSQQEQATKQNRRTLISL